MTDLYAQALWNLQKATPEGKSADAKTIVNQLVTHLKTSGRLKLLPHILNDLKKIEAREMKLASVVEVASEKEAAGALKAAAEQGIHAKEAKINHSLINGWRAISKEKLIDNSSKRALLDLYQSVTH